MIPEIPFDDFRKMFKLTLEEARAEGASGRIQAFATRDNDGAWHNLVTYEDNIRRWLQTELPPEIARKVTKAGRHKALDRWRHKFWANVQFHPESNSISYHGHKSAVLSLKSA